MKIVFMGTPDIAANSLDKLINSKHNIVGAFTQPDKPVGRHRVLTPPPVKVLAEKNNIPVFQPETLKDEKTFDILNELNPDLIAVVAYGKLLPTEILELPRFGCVNAHASLLPKYRGASPIQWSIVCGEKETGVTTMFMDKGMDTGDMIDSVKILIASDDNAETLYDKLSVAAAELLINTIDSIESGSAIAIPQNDDDASYAPIIKKEMGFVDFTENADVVHNKVRGLYTWPTAYTMLEGKRLKIFKTEIKNGFSKDAGTVISADNELVVACRNNTAISLLEVQLEGSKRMEIKQFLSGRTIKPDLRLG